MDAQARGMAEQLFGAVTNGADAERAATMTELLEYAMSAAREGLSADYIRHSVWKRKRWEEQAERKRARIDVGEGSSRMGSAMVVPAKVIEIEEEVGDDGENLKEKDSGKGKGKEKEDNGENTKDN